VTNGWTKPDGCRSERPGRAFLISCFLVLASAVSAGAEVTVDPLEVPRPPAATAYTDAAAGAKVETDVTYARQVTGDLSEGYDAPAAQGRRSSEPLLRPTVSRGVMVALVVLLIVGLLFLWLRFGGGGMLFARAPQDETPRPAPDAWKAATAGDVAAPGDALARIAAMADRRAAMIELLRYSLQVAASRTSVRFARSDTEREALRRLPGSWPGFTMLRQLLRDTELAHYGGRPVTEDRFQQALTAARTHLGGNAQGGQRA
jgi:hypothetical protein